MTLFIGMSPAESWGIVVGIVFAVTSWALWVRSRWERSERREARERHPSNWGN